MSRCWSQSAPAHFLPLNPEVPATLPLRRVSDPRKPRDILCLARNPALCGLRALPTPLPWLRLACPISLAWRGNLTNDHPRLAPARSRRPCSSLRASARQRARAVGIRLRHYGVKIGSPSRPIFAAKSPPSPETATVSPEASDPCGEASLPIVHDGCCRTTGAAAPLKT
jgi:hypothetical protein